MGHSVGQAAGRPCGHRRLAWPASGLKRPPKRRPCWEKCSASLVGRSVRRAAAPCHRRWAFSASSLKRLHGELTSPESWAIGSSCTPYPRLCLTWHGTSFAQQPAALPLMLCEGVYLTCAPGRVPCTLFRRAGLGIGCVAAGASQDKHTLSYMSVPMTMYTTSVTI